MRGEIYELPEPKDARGHEQRGRRYAVVVQSSDLPLSTWIVCPTSASARPSSFRPTVQIGGKDTQVQVDQMSAVDHQRLGALVGYLPLRDMQEVERAMRLMLGL